MTLTVDLVPHMDAGDRKKWPGDQDERPLSELGRRQALAQAEALAREPIDALYSGPALRCRQTLQPLAEQLGLEIGVLPGLGEKDAWREPDGWEDGPATAAHAAGRAFAALDGIGTLHPNGRVVACSHGHVIPVLVAFLVASRGLVGVPQLRHRGQWYRIRLGEADAGIELREAEGFPR